MSSIKAKSRSHHSSAHASSVKIIGPTTPELDKQLTQKFGLPQPLSSSNYELYNIEIDTIQTKSNSNFLGIQLTESCVVHSVNRDNVDAIFGDLWLEVNGIELKDKNHFTDLYRKLRIASNGSLKLKLKIARLLWIQSLPENRMPMDMLPRREYKYHLAIIYGIPKMHLTLSLKALNGKVFVSSVCEETLGRMAFSVGDAILEVDNSIIASITGAYDIIVHNLKTNGIVSCVVERADSKNANFYVLEALRSEKNPHKEERLNKDVEKICRKEKRKNFREPNIQPAKGIIKGKNSKSYQSIHVTFKPAHDVVHINADINPKLLQPVPSHNVLPADTLLAPGRSAESILSEISSEATTEEHQEPKLAKSRPMRQKDCRLTTGTKVIKQKRVAASTESPKFTPPPTASPAAGGSGSATSINNNNKSPTPMGSPKDTKDSDSGKKFPTPTTTGSTGTTTTTKTTQNTDSGKRTYSVVKTQNANTTLKTQNTESAKKGSTSKTQSKTPQDMTDSRKKTITGSRTPENTDSRKKNSVTKTKTSRSKDTSPKNSNSQRW